MDDVLTIGDVLWIALLVCGVVLLFSTIITRLLSKKFSTVWFLNKLTAALYLVGLAGIASISFLNPMPSVVFTKVVGFYPLMGINNLPATSEWRGELEQKNLTFSADPEMLKNILGKCFYEVSETEALQHMPSAVGKDYLNEFAGRRNVHYYERPSRDVGSCLSDFSSSYIAYDEKSGKTYLQWNFVHY
jgi:hypothetical protein